MQQDSVMIFLEGLDQDIDYISGNPILLTTIVTVFSLALVFILFNYVIFPQRKKHRDEQRKLEETIKIQQMEQAIREQKIRSAILHETIENERKRIAQELHDGLGTVLSSVKLQIEALQLKYKEDKEKFDKPVDMLIVGGKELRNIIHQLRPTQIERHGINKAITYLLQDEKKASGVVFNISQEEIPDGLTEFSQITIYRVLQEIFNNIRKHAEASVIDFHLFRLKDKIVIEVKDNGKGFNVKTAAQKKENSKGGYGLNNMVERVANTGGEAVIKSVPNRGTTVTLTIPVSENEEETTPREV